MIATMFDFLFGCRHKRTTRPITPLHKPGTEADTYVACLDCGKRFHYDVTTMSIGMPIPHPPAAYRPASGSFQTQN